MNQDSLPADVQAALHRCAATHRLDIYGGSVKRTSSRFCLGVEHGDYNGTELFGVGTDRFIWLAFKPNGSHRVRLSSTNFPAEGLIEFELGAAPGAELARHSWARFPFGADYVLHAHGYVLNQGFDAVIHGNIPGGGMSRSASLSLNLILTMLQVSAIQLPDGMQVVELAQRIENDYIGSPCGNLDQIMIYFAKDGMGTHYVPATQSVSYVPWGDGPQFRLASLDTGTDRPGLEKSTYRVRRAECEQFVELASSEFGIRCLADVRDEQTYVDLRTRFAGAHPQLVKRLKYIYEAQLRFPRMLAAWKRGDARDVGQIFRLDGFGLRDDYEISGPELESMCEIAQGRAWRLGRTHVGGRRQGGGGSDRLGIIG